MYDLKVKIVKYEESLNLMLNFNLFLSDIG